MHLALPIAAAAVLSLAPLQAQTVEASITGLTLANAEAYLAPLTDGFGQAMTSGTITSARPLDRLGIRVGLRVSGALFERGDAAFDVVLPASLEWNGTTYLDPYEVDGGFPRTPTAVGKGAGITLKPRNGSEFRRDLALEEESPTAAEWLITLPDGLDIPAAPYGVIDVSVGIGLGTQVTASVLPSVELSAEVGSLSGLGVTVMHSLSQHTGFTDLDVAAVAGFQRSELGDYLDATAAHVGVAASRTLGSLSVYGNVSAVSSSVDVRFEASSSNANPALPAAGSTVSFSADPGVQPRLAFGGVLDLVLFQLSGEYALAEFRTFSGGVSVDLR